MNNVHGMTEVTCGQWVVEEQQEPGYEITPDRYPKEQLGEEGAEAFIQETEHDHIKFQECNWRENKGSNEKEGAINRSSQENERPVPEQQQFDDEAWTDPRNTNKVKVQNFRPIKGELLRITLRL